MHHLFLSGRSQKGVTLRTIEEALEVSRATVKRDLALMRDSLGAPILFDRATHRYRYDETENKFELPGLWFNASELYALLASQQLLETVQPGFLRSRIGPLKTRIRQLLGASGYDAQIVSERVKLQGFAVRNVDNETFGRVSRAVLSARQAAITYEGRARAESTHRVIHPYTLLHYRDNWYLAAWCENSLAIRIFSLDRIREVTNLDKPVGEIDEKALDRELGASFGIFSGVAEDWAVLRFSPERAKWVADERWHPAQLGRYDGEVYELQVPYSNPTELVLDILKFGADVEVVSPPSLRTLVARRLRMAAALYEE